MSRRGPDNAGFDIAGRKVGPGAAVFVIAEIGTNHNGDFDRAIEMIDRVVGIGADCAKFQMRDLASLYRKRSLSGEDDDLSVEYTLDLLRRFELTGDQHARLARHCKDRGLIYLCTPWDEASVARLEGFPVPAYKVASADLTNMPLIERLTATGRPLILSTGMSTSAEIRHTVTFLRERGAAFALLHCNSTYPAAFQNIQLRYMERLRALHPIVGYSGHERGIVVSLAAVALGAQILERHVTLDRNMEGPDHAASLEFDDFATLAEGVRQIESALGDGGERKMSQGELINRENLGKSLVAKRALQVGHVLKRDDIAVKSPGKGLSPQRLEDLVGRSLAQDMAAEDFFYETDLAVESSASRAYRFRRPWGVPVRYHDFNEFMGRCRPDFIEFHLSYRDLDLDPGDFLSGSYEMGFVVHAPELFAGSHLMDLATPDEAYRANSLAETQRVIEITRRLKSYFPKIERPLIVANIGGFSMDAPLPEAEKPAYYARLAESLGRLDLDGVELIPQTAAPFPWHFGGQRYQNLFLLAEETASFCHQHGLRVCLDLSHSYLAANRFGFDFGDFLHQVGPVTAHIHISDAAGVDGEGLQVGEGDMDFPRMARKLDEVAPETSFIPEIWQGHKNGGQGFWTALDRLEAWF